MSVKYYPFSLNSHEYRVVHIRPTDVDEVEALVELDQVWLHPTGTLNSPVMVSVDVRGYHQMVTRPLAILFNLILSSSHFLFSSDTTVKEVTITVKGCSVNSANARIWCCISVLIRQICLGGKFAYLGNVVFLRRLYILRIMQ